MGHLMGDVLVAAFTAVVVLAALAVATVQLPRWCGPSREAQVVPTADERIRTMERIAADTIAELRRQPRNRAEAIRQWLD